MPEHAPEAVESAPFTRTDDYERQALDLVARGDAPTVTTPR